MPLTEAEKAQIHLLADALNNFSVGLVLAGGATPVLNYMLDGKIPSGYIIGVVVMSAAVSFAAYWGAWRLLARLDD